MDIQVNFFNDSFLLDKPPEPPRWCFDWQLRNSLTCSFEDLCEYLETAPVPEYKDKLAGHWFNFLRTRPDLPAATVLKRNQRDQFSGLSVLTLDFDGGLSIEEFIDRFSVLSYLLYTTHSHLSPEKRFKPCFRVLVQLSSLIPLHLLDAPSVNAASIKPALLELFEGVDESCFEPPRAFYRPGRRPGAEFVLLRNEGLPLDYRDLELTPPLVRPPPAPRFVDLSQPHAELIRYSLDLYAFFEHKGWLGSTSNGHLAVTCPNEAQHSNTGRDGASQLSNYAGTWHFNCYHGHCGGTKWVTDLIFGTHTTEELRPFCSSLSPNTLRLSRVKKSKEGTNA